AAGPPLGGPAGRGGVQPAVHRHAGAGHVAPGHSRLRASGGPGRRARRPGRLPAAHSAGRGAAAARRALGPGDRLGPGRGAAAAAGRRRPLAQRGAAPGLRRPGPHRAGGKGDDDGAVKTRVLKTDPLRPDAAVIDEAARIIAAGGLVAFPTETVYGLGADALNGRAVRGIFAAKGRPADNPLIVHVAEPAQLPEVAQHVPEAVDALARHFWPGPLTVVVPRRPEVPDEVTAGLDTV